MKEIYLSHDREIKYYEYLGKHMGILEVAQVYHQLITRV